MHTPPDWITPSNLGVYSETYSFNIDPIVVEFNAHTGNTVSQINGALPSGLAWLTVGSNVEVYGESTATLVVSRSTITWRVTDPYGSVADRTYYLQINPVAVPPDWVGQPTFLGYAASATTSTYNVTAHTTGTLPITYSIAAFAPPAGISINGTTGQITYAAPSITADQTTAFTLRATTGSLYSDLPVTIDLLTVPHAPAWVTKSGLLELVSAGSFVELALEAYDSSSGDISYSLVNSTPSFPFELTSTGLIYGTVPTVYVITVYQFTIAAASNSGSTARTFDIIASPVSPSNMLYWVSPSDMGTHQDAQFIVLDCAANSARGGIRYSLVGGILPRGMVLDRSNGQISGFLEYQTRTRSYEFDIIAQDSVQTITRQFRLTVTQSTQYQSMDLTIPVEGPLKNAFYSYIGDTVDPRWVPNSQTTPQSVLYPPLVQLITGLNYAIDDPAMAMYWGNLNLNTTELMIGTATNVNVSTSSTLFYSPILDADAGAAPQYAQADNVVTAATGTVRVAQGTVSVIVAPGNAPWLAGAKSGTAVRLTLVGSPNIWLQGPITSYGPRSVTMVIAATMVSGSGTYSSWQLGLAPTYPPSLVNIRNDLIAGLGWVNDGQGQGAQLLALVDPTSTAVIGAAIVNPGLGYLYGPKLNVLGTGNGAVLGANLTIITANIAVGGTGWQPGDQILLPQPAVSPAQLRVSNVDAQGSITELSITDGGEYSSWPAGVTLLTNDQGEPAVAEIKLGIGNIWIQSSGNGYAVGTTVVATGGSEQLPQWQSSWEPVLTLGTVYQPYGALVVGNTTPDTAAQLWYRRWPLQHVILELQGINWTGDTTLDQSFTSFDGGTTFFTEWLEPRDTILDQDLTLFNQGNTRFDDDFAAWQQLAYYAWGITRFDSNFTIFDLYATDFDDGAIPTQSVTQLRRLIRVVTQQISGHNVVA
jgi:hypothetical protein